MSDRWIECECPAPGGFDFDIFDDAGPLPGPDTMVYCTCCGAEHRAGAIGQMHIEQGDRIRTLSEHEWRAAAAATADDLG